MTSLQRDHPYAARLFRRLPLLVTAFLLFAHSPAWSDVSYSSEIRLEGVKDRALERSLRDVSQLVKLEDKLPPSEAALRRRAEDDLPRLKEVVQAAGYWTPQLSYRLAPKDDSLKVEVIVDPGPLFHLEIVTLHGPSGEALPLLDQLGPAAFGLTIGAPARSAPVAAAEQQIVETYARNGHPFAKVVDHRAVVDVAKDTMSVTYTVDPGPEAHLALLPSAVSSVSTVPMSRRGSPGARARSTMRAWWRRRSRTSSRTASSAPCASTMATRRMGPGRWR